MLILKLLKMFFYGIFCRKNLINFVENVMISFEVVCSFLKKKLYVVYGLESEDSGEEFYGV